MPQLAVSVAVLTLQPLLSGLPVQCALGAVQVNEQVLLAHEAAPVPAVTAQAWAHVPQLALSLLVSTSQPLLALLSQSASGAVQLTALHWPPEQLGVVPASLQALVQEPQCVGSLAVAVSQPSESS